MLINPAQEFNARTAHYNPGTPIPARITVRPDRSFHFSLRTPPTATLLLSAAGVAPTKNKIRGAGNVPGPMNNHEGQKGKTSTSSPTVGNAVHGTVGTVSLKHVYEIELGGHCKEHCWAGGEFGSGCRAVDGLQRKALELYDQRFVFGCV